MEAIQDALDLWGFLQFSGYRDQDEDTGDAHGM